MVFEHFLHDEAESGIVFDDLAAYDTVFSRRIAEKRSRGLKQTFLHSYADRQKTARVIAVCLGQFGVSLGSVWGHLGSIRRASRGIREHQGASRKHSKVPWGLPGCSFCEYCMF